MKQEIGKFWEGAKTKLSSVSLKGVANTIVSGVATGAAIVIVAYGLNAVKDAVAGAIHSTDDAVESEEPTEE